MKGNLAAHLQVVHTKHVARSRKNAPIEDDMSLTHVENTSDREQTMKRKARSMQEQRVSRIDALRAQVRAGTYRVDTLGLAQRILENGTHFMESTLG